MCYLSIGYLWVCSYMEYVTYDLNTFELILFTINSTVKIDTLRFGFLNHWFNNHPLIHPKMRCPVRHIRFILFPFHCYSTLNCWNWLGMERNLGHFYLLYFPYYLNQLFHLMLDNSVLYNSHDEDIVHAMINYNLKI